MGNRINLPKQIKLPNMDLSKAGDVIGKAGKFVVCHKKEFFLAGSSMVVIDDIRVRFGRRKDQKDFEKSSVTCKKIACKHAAEINAMRSAAEQAQEANNRLALLEQIVKNKNITEGSGSE
jgi:hypothetical protein